MTDMLLLATEGVEGLPPEHIASQLAVPIGIVIFVGAVFLLMWSNYGAKKGALIEGVALFGFCAAIGVFWWFGAPGTPVATGLQNFPGQPADQYTAKWYPFEAGSPRAEPFDLWREGPDAFQTVEEFVGTSDESDPLYASVRGDLDGASSLMIDQFFPRENGSLQIGASLRTELQQATEAVTDQAPAGSRFEDWVTEVAGSSDASEYDTQQLFIAEDSNGQRVAAARLETFAVFVDSELGTEVARFPVYEIEWFAFKDPGAIWFPSAIWTLISFIGFALCLALLDRIEQREKEEKIEAEEPMDVQVPIAQ